MKPCHFNFADLDRRSVSVERSILPATGSGETDGRRLHPPAPLLVTAGHGPDGLVMVNLESLGTLQVNGNPTGIRGCRSCSGARAGNLPLVRLV